MFLKMKSMGSSLSQLFPSKLQVVHAAASATTTQAPPHQSGDQQAMRMETDQKETPQTRREKFQT